MFLKHRENRCRFSISFLISQTSQTDNTTSPVTALELEEGRDRSAPQTKLLVFKTVLNLRDKQKPKPVTRGPFNDNTQLEIFRAADRRLQVPET